MHQGKLEIPADDGAVSEGMRYPLAWSDLVARLAARNDFRTIASANRDLRRASFDTLSVGKLTEGRQEIARGKPPVNPDALSDGKYPWAMSSGEVGDKAQGDREIR